MRLLDSHSILLALLSLTRTMLLHDAPGTTIPLASVTPEVFADTAWSGLGITNPQRERLFKQLATMFPGGSFAQSSGSSQSLLSGELPVRRQGCQTATPKEMAEEVFAAWLKGTRQVVYSSSGSSGTPKLLAQAYDLIEQEVECLAGFFPAIRRVLGLTPQHHCYGFIFGVLLHKRLGASYSVHPPLPTIVRHAMAEDTLAVGYPDLWKRVHTEGFKPPKGFICLSAGSPWPDESIEKMLSSGYNILEIYGSSENGAIGRRSGPHDFTLLPYWRKNESAPDAPELIRELPSGEKLRCGIQDQLAWSGERSFRPLKRLDSAVQISGINVYPALTAAVLMEHPEVLDCRVRPMREQEGWRLKAFVVARPECGDLRRLREELRRLCKNRLSSPERPVKFTFGREIPRNDFGKECDWKIK